MFKKQAYVYKEIEFNLELRITDYELRGRCQFCDLLFTSLRLSGYASARLITDSLIHAFTHSRIDKVNDNDSGYSI
jgi:hypothetical protein